jgi:hypothetical protein
MKKIVRLTENDIKRIVKKTLLSEDMKYSFMDEYSNNLERIEKSHADDDDKLQAIVDVYKHRIDYIQNYLKGNKDKDNQKED